MFERTKADKTGGDAGNDGGSFDCFAAYRMIGTDDAERPRRRHAEAGHCFGTEKFADR
jgi:hypothetical protein